MNLRKFFLAVVAALTVSAAVVSSAFSDNAWTTRRERTPLCRVDGRPGQGRGAAVALQRVAALADRLPDGRSLHGGACRTHRGLDGRRPDRLRP